jgi:hypothetical protein
MKLFDLFAGSRSVAKVAESLGWETWSTDIEPFEGIDTVKNIYDITAEDFPYTPDVVWASPPCEGFSVGSIGKHWNKDHTPKTQKGADSILIVHATLFIIGFLLNCNPKLLWYIENPRGKLRKLEVVKGLPRRVEVCYCQYGDTRMKPTDIWTNDMNWQPKPMCFNGNTDCHHEPAPRGSKTGTQGLKNYFEKSKIPENLIKEILNGNHQWEDQADGFSSLA